MTTTAVPARDYYREIRELGRKWDPPLAAFFDALREAGDARFFHPHPLTAEAARELAVQAVGDLYYVLVRGQRVLGYGMLRGWDDGYSIPSLGIALHPHARGCGLGRAFMRFLHAAARRRGATSVRLKVHSDNAPAIHLYRRLGYRFDGEEDGGQLVGHIVLATR